MNTTPESDNTDILLLMEKTIFPSGSVGGEVLRRVYMATGRLHEVSIVNAQKAPELLAAFNMAYLDANNCKLQLQLQLQQAQRASALRRATVILDEVPRLLREKGLASGRSPGGSEDQREAVLAQDQEYLALEDQVSRLKACVEYMKVAADGFENAFTSVKKILGETSDWRGLTDPRHLSAGNEQIVNPAPIGTGVAPAVTGIRAQFGKAGR